VTQESALQKKRGNFEERDDHPSKQAVASLLRLLLFGENETHHTQSGCGTLFIEGYSSKKQDMSEMIKKSLIKQACHIHSS
jgi:hypothetical protein